MNSHFDTQTAISQLSAKVLFSSFLRKIIICTQHSSCLLIFIQGETTQQQVRQIKECARVTQKKKKKEKKDDTPMRHLNFVLYPTDLSKPCGQIVTKILSLFLYVDIF